MREGRTEGNEGGREKNGGKQRKVVVEELFLPAVCCILKAAFIRPHIKSLD